MWYKVWFCPTTRMLFIGIILYYNLLKNIFIYIQHTFLPKLFRMKLKDSRYTLDILYQNTFKLMQVIFHAKWWSCFSYLGNANDSGNYNTYTCMSHIKIAPADFRQHQDMVRIHEHIMGKRIIDRAGLQSI